MQPLVSPVDHESRHNSTRAGQDAPDEGTPLLRFPRARPHRDTSTIAIVSALIFLLISGVVIGIYLLVLQSESENILPPVNIPLQLVTRLQWDPNRPVTAPDWVLPRAKHVIVVHTATDQCTSSRSCVNLLQQIQSANNSAEPLPYNFLMSTNGQTFEGLGWRRSSELFPDYSPTALVVAFIGNYTNVNPSRAQLEETKNLIAESVSQQHLDPVYVVLGKKVGVKPTELFKSMKSFPFWSNELSDK